MAAAPTPAKLFEGLLTDEGEELSALLDGASVPGLLERLDADRSIELKGLFHGKLEPDMAEVPPYLVKLSHESEFRDGLVGTGWGHHWPWGPASRGMSGR